MATATIQLTIASLPQTHKAVRKGRVSAPVMSSSTPRTYYPTDSHLAETHRHRLVDIPSSVPAGERMPTETHTTTTVDNPASGGL